MKVSKNGLSLPPGWGRHPGSFGKRSRNEFVLASSEARALWCATRHLNTCRHCRLYGMDHYSSP